MELFFFITISENVIQFKTALFGQGFSLDKNNLRIKKINNSNIVYRV